MNLLRTLKEAVLEATRMIFKEATFKSILWIVNIGPYLAGFSFKKVGISAWFWIVHLSLLFYLYFVGSFWFQWKFAKGAGDFIKSYLNITVLILTANNSWWFITQRPLLREVLKKLEQSDEIAQGSVYLLPKHKYLMKIVKRIVFIFYAVNYFDGFCIYLPHRIDVLNTYSMTPCVGIEPLTVTPKKEICLLLLAVQELTIMLVMLNYQALVLFLIAHTTALFQMLAYELTYLNDNYNGQENKELARETLLSVIDRHTLLLELVDNLKSLYSIPIGVNFGNNAVIICLFFYLPLREWLQFMPVLGYCFTTFFFYCYLGQRLINSAEMFERSVYGCGWENFDLKEKKLVFMMLRQSQKQVELLAADIIPVNIRSFATTIQAMFRFITVVKF